ncbi:MAG: glycosyltransferase [Planctomycetes bacterium]|nr:glycosyltransferase [Planctomycetota bacterium]
MSGARPTTRPVIAHVLHRLYLAGAEVLAADLSRRLRDRFDFVFFCLDGVGPLGETLRGEGFGVVNLSRKPGVDLSVARRIRAEAKARGVRLFHAHQYTPMFYAAMSRLPPAAWLPRRRPRILFTEHGRHYPDVRSPKRVFANRLLLSGDPDWDRVTAVGAFVKQALVNNEGLAADRVEVIYNGIDPSRFGMADHEATRATIRAELGLSPTRPVLLQVARFHPVKDHATALHALAHVVRDWGATQGEKPVLLLAGDGEKRGELEAMARSLNIADDMRFIGVRDDVPALMAAADVFVLSSLSEGISVTLLEAMGCGLPIATTDVGGNGEVVIHGETGLLSPRADPRKLADNLLMFLRDPALRRLMGDAGRKRLLTRFTQERMHARYAESYEEMTR